MKKIIVKLRHSTIFGFILGILLCSGIVYGVNLYNASDIEYTTSDGEQTNVNNALNDLYIITNLGNATANDISEGKTAVVQGKEVIGTSKPLNLITKDIAYFSGTTNASGVITKRIYASDLGMSRIIGLTKGSVEEYIKTAGHFLSIAPSADGTYADLTCYMSYGGQTVKCGATIIGVAN